MKVFRSVRFNIFLGALIAIAAALGTFLPQVPDAPEKVSAFQQAHAYLFPLYNCFGLFDLYHTWWFMALLGLMAFDVVACKLWNKPPDAGMVALPPELTDERELERRLARKEAALRLKPLRARFGVPGGAGAAAARLRAALSARGYHVQEELRSDSGAALVATRHRLQRWGSYVAHIALVVILAGALVKCLFGFVEMVPVLEGGSRAMQNKPWTVYVDKFTVKYYDGTFTPKTFSSVLRVQDADKVLGAKTIRVNDPLDIGGVRFYQASWGAGGMFRSVALRLGHALLRLPQRVPTRVPGTPFDVTADVMLPNFTISGGKADTASLELKNPAVRFTFAVGAHKTAPMWLLQNYPKLCLVEDPQGTLSPAPAPPFQLASIDPVLFSGIQVAYDPGYKIVVAGALLWLFGTVTLFYLHRRRLWILAEPGGDGTEVTIGGWSSRAGREFEPEFKALAESLRRELGGRAGVEFFQNPLVEVS